MAPASITLAPQPPPARTKTVELSLAMERQSLSDRVRAVQTTRKVVSIVVALTRSHDHVRAFIAVIRGGQGMVCKATRPRLANAQPSDEGGLPIEVASVLLGTRSR